VGRWGISAAQEVVEDQIKRYSQRPSFPVVKVMMEAMLIGGRAWIQPASLGLSQQQHVNLPQKGRVASVNKAQSGSQPAPRGGVESSQAYKKYYKNVIVIFNNKVYTDTSNLIN